MCDRPIFPGDPVRLLTSDDNCQAMPCPGYDAVAGRTAGNQPAAGRRLRWTDRDQLAVGDALLLDHRHPGIQVNVGPAT
jgi:hypothetical protein